MAFTAEYHPDLRLSRLNINTLPFSPDTSGDAEVFLIQQSLCLARDLGQGRYALGLGLEIYGIQAQLYLDGPTTPLVIDSIGYLLGGLDLSYYYSCA